MDKKNSKGSAAIIIFLILLALFAILYTYFYAKAKASEVSTLTLDKVNMNIQSKDEENHSVELQVSVEGSSQVLDSSKKKEFELIVADVLSKSDYERITGKDGTDYIKNEVKSELEKNYGEAISDIYINSLLCDTELPPEGNDKRNQNAKDVIKGLLPNIDY